MPADLKRIRTDQVGSLLRPRALIDAFLKIGRGEISEAELADEQDRAVNEVVARQEAAGLEVVTDGEYRRLNWQVSFSRVNGWDQTDRSLELCSQSKPGDGRRNPS